MDGNLHNGKVYRFLLMALLMAGMVAAPASAVLKSGTWQEVNAATDAINGTVPLADGVTVPVYQGSILLNPEKTNTVSFSAMPRDFSTDDAPSALQLVNPVDTEGDIFAVPPVRWDTQMPVIDLIWADAATPDEPLDPQPAANKTFCAQNMAGGHFVVWPQINADNATTLPALYLQTITGTPFSNTISVLSQKIPVDIAAAAGDPVTVTADHFDEQLNAAKVKAGESIALTITTRDCQGEAVGNTAFVITRGDALNRQNGVNNAAPVHVGDTELTTVTTEYHGTTDANGKATVVVTQASGPGVKTPLTVFAAGAPQLKSSIAVIFTTLTSPDTPFANMWGHMTETSSADVEGETYTFTRPQLAAETDGESGVVSASNENWALFNWGGADTHCEILPDARQLMGLKIARGDLVTSLGWPVAGNNEYWSSSAGTLMEYHLGVNMLTRSVVEERDETTSLVSCVDKASPAVKPEITLTLDSMDSELNAARVRVGDSINMRVTIKAKETGAALPYRYFDLYVGDEQNRKGQTNAEARAEGSKYGWVDNPVLVGLTGSGTPNHYHGITGADGQLTLMLTQDDGAGVLTPLRVVAAEGAEATANVIFTVVTSPDNTQARMWGHMQGVVEAGNIYKRPLLASEASANTGSTVENHEDWATFSSVAAATSQCGTGQVPGQLLLDALYSAHSDNAMATTYGWPTSSHSYISADTDGTQTAHVNLATGADGMFSGSEPNYLSCSGNELVTQLTVWFNDDVSLRQATAKVGETVMMHIHSVNALNGLVVPNAAFTVTMAQGKNRKGLITGFTDPSDGALEMGGTFYGASQASMTLQGTTDAEGNAAIAIAQPQGVGLLTQLNVVPVNSLITTPVERSVKFTVPTSPDTPNAQMWGHMVETVTVDGLTFERPKLASEVSATRTQLEDNETWARVTHSDAAGNAAAGGCAANRLPRADQLAALYNANSGGAMHNLQGWPIVESYWSATPASATAWQMTSLSNGTESADGSASVYTSCLTSDNPMAATITLTPENAAQWNEASQAAKVKKGETLKLKVTVNDASGNPLPGATFVLSRGDGYTRQGSKHIAGSGDGIVAPVVIDGESLNDTATRIGGITGADGSKIINVTRPDTAGTKVAIAAALYDNASVSDSIDTIFTVATSPDSDKAVMWGHMPETVTAANGTVFKRPLLFAEISAGSAVSSSVENNETWGIVDYYGIAEVCGAGYVPALADLQSLYAAWPAGAMNTQQGWPVDEKNYQNSTADLSRTPENRYVKSLNLRDNSITSQLWSEKLYFSCLQNAHPAATQLTLTSSLYNESDGFAKAKVGESIPLVITTLDAQGNPVGNTPVIFGRGDSVGRANQDVNGSEAAMIQINHGEGRASRAEYYTVTGEDGTLALEVSQDSGAGFKTPLQATIDDHSDTTQTLSVVFTVATSPDSEKANYWGHMAETVTDGNGQVYQRPKLASEFSATPGKTITLTYGDYDKGETWGMVTGSDAWSGSNGGCGQASLPGISDLQALYSHYPNGAMRTTNGWPVSSAGSVSASQRWWAGEQVVDASNKAQYAVVNLFSGGDATTAYNTSYYMQTCLATPRVLASKLTLTLANEDETTGIAKAKKGEKMAATVTATDSAGQPVAGVLIKVSRGNALTRAGGVYTANGADDIALTDIQPADQATFLMDTTSAYLYVKTNAQGQVTFNLSQDATVGLKTPIMVTAADDSTLTDTKDAIFTVLTSPDSDKAVYWGHMPETFTNSNGVEFQRPLLSAEIPSTSNTSKYMENGETWYAWNRYSYMKSDNASPCGVSQLATMEELTTLYNDYPNGGLSTTFGLPVTSDKYWGAGNVVTDATSGYAYQYINLNNGETYASFSKSVQTAKLCRTTTRTLSIAMSSGSWNAEKLAATAKKGVKIPVTIAVTDQFGAPQANIVVRLDRGASQTRNTSGTYDYTVSSNLSVTPDSEGANAATLTYRGGMSTDVRNWYATTDSKGEIRFELSQDSTTGLKTGLTALLMDNSVMQSAMDVIFTVITSPDSDKARYWGHMPETAANSAGVTFRRPLLAAEMSSYSSTFTYNNEIWPLIAAANAQKAGASGCDVEYQPLLSDMQTLFFDNMSVSGGIGAVYGWPVGSNQFWWAADRAASTGNYQYISLSAGGSGSTSNSSTTAAQVCLVEARAQAGSITLTSTAMDAAKSAAVAKQGESIPLTVTVKDTLGNPMANQPFTLSRGESLNRAGVVITDGDVEAEMGADDMVLRALTPVSGVSDMTTAASVYSGTTGSDGTATFTVNQNKTLGLKTSLTAALASDTSKTATLDAIFTVHTSPDTDKANFWGDMPDTVSANGKTLHRPLLLAELPAGKTPPLHVLMNKEEWAMAHTVDASTWDLAAQCGSLSAAASLDDLKALHSGFSSTGWPSTSSYAYLSQTVCGANYCGYNHTSGTVNSYVNAKTTAGFASCAR
ncbi:adhesion domain-containing protein [Citrobacter youngae]|uniref:RatA-like protein n=1 Tax=Citrobacter youngae ATCC 29220 TaxID=500640 RepID=D4B6S1_9ENTR|nr:hypothetical protein CIT292_06009 [Citrobacter youngae ATCC 29220]